MLNKIILFLWKIRVCLLCFEMVEQGHPMVWSHKGWHRGEQEFGVQGEWGFGDAGWSRALLASPTAPLLLVPEGAQGPITRATTDIYLF